MTWRRRVKQGYSTRGLGENYTLNTGSVREEVRGPCLFGVQWYLEACPPLLGGTAKQPAVLPPESLEDRELRSPRSPDVMELLVRLGEMSSTWKSTTGSSLSWQRHNSLTLEQLVEKRSFV